jgi:hypothetical protein
VKSHFLKFVGAASAGALTAARPVFAWSKFRRRIPRLLFLSFHSRKVNKIDVVGEGLDPRQTTRPLRA